MVGRYQTRSSSNPEIVPVMRNFSLGVIEKSIIEGDGKDVMKGQMHPKTAVVYLTLKMIDQIAYIRRIRREVVYALPLTVNGTLLFAGYDTNSKSPELSAPGPTCSPSKE